MALLVSPYCSPSFFSLYVYFSFCIFCVFKFSLDVSSSIFLFWLFQTILFLPCLSLSLARSFYLLLHPLLKLNRYHARGKCEQSRKAKRINRRRKVEEKKRRNLCGHSLGRGSTLAGRWGELDKKRRKRQYMVEK